MLGNKERVGGIVLQEVEGDDSHSRTRDLQLNIILNRWGAAIQTSRKCNSRTCWTSRRTSAFAFTPF